MATYWIKAESDQLRELALAGKTDPQIAVIMGRTTSSIKHRRKRMGVPSASRENGKGRSWPRDEDELLIEMCKKNLADSTIARSLNRTIAGVQTRIQRIGARGNFPTPRYIVEDLRPENAKACSNELMLFVKHFNDYAHAYYRARKRIKKGYNATLPPEMPRWSKRKDQLRASRESKAQVAAEIAERLGERQNGSG